MKKKTIYVELYGGLGNQFFQYVYARNIQIAEDANIVFLTKSYKTDLLRAPSIFQFYIDENCQIDSTFDYYSSHRIKCFFAKIIDKIQLIFDKGHSKDKMLYCKLTISYKISSLLLNLFGVNTHLQSRYLYPHRALFTNTMYARGSWQTPIYADQMQDVILNEFVLKHNAEVPKQLLNDIMTSESVCVHIRRGDYCNYNYYIVCDIDYYKRAINKMKDLHPNCKLFVFSDDIVWVKENLKEDAFFVEEAHPDYVDFELMRYCKHFIISNSTFSWWAAYLGNRIDKTVITPDRWYKKEFGENREQLNIKNWIVQETET